MVKPGQVVATRGRGSDTDYALFVLLLSAEGMRSLFMADRMPTLEDVKKAFFYVSHVLGDQKGYVVADVVDPAFMVRSTGGRLIDSLFDAIEPWLDGGAEPMEAMEKDLIEVEAFSVTLEIAEEAQLNWRQLTADGFQPAFSRIGDLGPSQPKERLRHMPRRRDGKGFG